jgi:hypothetical protein
MYCVKLCVSNKRERNKKVVFTYVRLDQCKGGPVLGMHVVLFGKHGTGSGWGWQVSRVKEGGGVEGLYENSCACQHFKDGVGLYRVFIVQLVVALCLLVDEIFLIRVHEVAFFGEV